VCEPSLIGAACDDPVRMRHAADRCKPRRRD
jgi:hypothetical protein